MSIEFEDELKHKGYLLTSNNIYTCDCNKSKTALLYYLYLDDIDYSLTVEAFKNIKYGNFSWTKYIACDNCCDAKINSLFCYSIPFNYREFRNNLLVNNENSKPVNNYNELSYTEEDIEEVIDEKENISN
jgi:hypothetical protein